jgi:hypothetical protein
MFITIGSRGINTDHITDVDLDASVRYQAFNVKDWYGKGVRIWLTSVTWSEGLGNGPASEARDIELRGEEAARFRVWWERYADDLVEDELNQDYMRLYAEPTTPMANEIVPGIQNRDIDELPW